MHRQDVVQAKQTSSSPLVSPAKCRRTGSSHGSAVTHRADSIQSLTSVSEQSQYGRHKPGSAAAVSVTSSEAQQSGKRSKHSVPLRRERSKPRADVPCISSSLGCHSRNPSLPSEMDLSCHISGDSHGFDFAPSSCSEQQHTLSSKLRQSFSRSNWSLSAGHEQSPERERPLSLRQRFGIPSGKRRMSFSTARDASSSVCDASSNVLDAPYPEPTRARLAVPSPPLSEPSLRAHEPSAERPQAPAQQSPERQPAHPARSASASADNSPAQQAVAASSRSQHCAASDQSTCTAPPQCSAPAAALGLAAPAAVQPSAASAAVQQRAAGAAADASELAEAAAAQSSHSAARPQPPVKRSAERQITASSDSAPLPRRAHRDVWSRAHAAGVWHGQAQAALSQLSQEWDSLCSMLDEARRNGAQSQSAAWAGPDAISAALGKLSHKHSFLDPGSAGRGVAVAGGGDGQAGANGQAALGAAAGADSSMSNALRNGLCHDLFDDSLCMAAHKQSDCKGAIDALRYARTSRGGGSSFMSASLDAAAGGRSLRHSHTGRLSAAAPMQPTIDEHLQLDGTSSQLAAPAANSTHRGNNNAVPGVRLYLCDGWLFCCACTSAFVVRNVAS